MIDLNTKKQKIISFLEENGPTLPVRISGVIEMDPVFASAILGELFSDGKIKMSHMKIGSSHLYFLPGQEQKLENFEENLKQPEKEALKKLKEKKILIDEEESPVIRVALANLDDFTKPILHNDKKIWKYSFASEDQIIQIINPKKTPLKEEEIEKEEKPIENKIEKEPKKEKEEIEKKIEDIFETNIKSEFLEEVEKFLSEKNILLYEKIQVDKKEVIGKINFETPLGKFNFLLIAKNKKSISKDEINSVLQQVNYHKMPCFLLVKKIPKSIQNLLKENCLIKIESLQP